MGVVQLSVFFLLVFHYNSLLQIHSYYNPIWFFSLLESMIWSPGQWRFWSFSADALEDVSALWGRHSPGSTELSPSTLGFSIGEQMPSILPAPPGDPHQAVPPSLIYSLIQWMFTEHLLVDWKKNTPPKVEHYVLFDRHSEDFKPGTGFQITLTSFSARNRAHVVSRPR